LSIWNVLGFALKFASIEYINTVFPDISDDKDTYQIEERILLKLSINNVG
jgi:hypothetical protein